jgi:hypothetical protein
MKILVMAISMILAAHLVFAAACSTGQIACADSTCNETSCKDHGGKRLGDCNSNGICEPGEECGCRDCILENQAGSCISGLCSSSGFCMENCTGLVNEFSLADIFSFTKTVPSNSDIYVSTFDYWILDEYGNQIPVEVGLRAW